MKTMNDKSFIKYDYLTILVKKEKYDEVISNYQSFGWKLTDTKQHSQYENILEVTFRRNHHIPNKDDLQFLQVNMEYDVNRLGKLEKNKHSISTMIGIILGLLGAGFATGSVLLFTMLSSTIAIIFASICTIMALALFTLTPILLVKALKKEELNYNKKALQCNNSIVDVCQKARELLEVENEKH